MAVLVVAGPAVAQDRDDLAQARARIDALEDQLDAAAAEADGASWTWRMPSSAWRPSRPWSTRWPSASASSARRFAMPTTSSRHCTSSRSRRARPCSSEFGWRWGRPHKGLDIDDNVSSAIFAAQSGTVISAGWNSGGYGNLTLIKHGDGVVTAYAHQSSIHVSTGQTVSRGQQIGIIGTTGSSTGTHLHFETRVGGGAVNPRNFLSGGC